MIHKIGLAEKINGIINQLDNLRIDDENILISFKWEEVKA